MNKLTTIVLNFSHKAGDSILKFYNEERYSPLTYNKPDLRNGSFIIGLDRELDKVE